MILLLQKIDKICKVDEHVVKISCVLIGAIMMNIIVDMLRLWQDQ